MIPLLSQFYFTLNKELYITKQNNGTKWAQHNTLGQKCQRGILEDFMWHDNEVPQHWKKKKATPLPWDFCACLQELPLPTHPISFGECSDICLQLLCSDADLEKLLHMDAFNHTALNETSKDSATHHSCHVFSALWGRHCCAKPLQSHYQLAYDQMITKVNTHT